MRECTECGNLLRRDACGDRCSRCSGMRRTCQADEVPIKEGRARFLEPLIAEYAARVARGERLFERTPE